MDESSRGHVRSSLVADKSVCVSYTLMSSKLFGEKACIDICELNLRKSLADIFVLNGCGVVRVDPIMSGSQFKRLCALHPKEKMRSHRRPFNTICTTKTTAFFSVDSWRDTW